jgi:hypothetical protein
LFLRSGFRSGRISTDIRQIPAVSGRGSRFCPPLSKAIRRHREPRAIEGGG